MRGVVGKQCCKAAVERHEAAFAANCQIEEDGVGDLVMTLNSLPDFGENARHLVVQRPEVVIGRGQVEFENPENFDRLDDHIYCCRLHRDADKTGLRQRAGGPSAMAVGLEPAVGGLIMDVI